MQLTQRATRKARKNKSTPRPQNFQEKDMIASFFLRISDEIALWTTISYLEDIHVRVRQYGIYGYSIQSTRDKNSILTGNIFQACECTNTYLVNYVEGFFVMCRTEQTS